MTNTSLSTTDNKLQVQVKLSKQEVSIILISYTYKKLFKYMLTQNHYLGKQ